MLLSIKPHDCVLMSQFNRVGLIVGDSFGKCAIHFGRIMYNALWNVYYECSDRNVFCNGKGVILQQRRSRYISV